MWIAQSGDPRASLSWSHGRATSVSEFKKIYNIFGFHETDVFVNERSTIRVKFSNLVAKWHISVWWDRKKKEVLFKRLNIYH